MQSQERTRSPRRTISADQRRSREFERLFEKHLERFGTVPWGILESSAATSIPLLRKALEQGVAVTEWDLGLPPGAIA